MSFEILYYYLINSTKAINPKNQFIAEIKRTDLDKDCPKSEKYYWLYYDGKSLKKLEYKDSCRNDSLKLEIRMFNEGSFIFDNYYGYLMKNSNNQILKFWKQLPNNINAKSFQIIKNFIK